MATSVIAEAFRRQLAQLLAHLSTILPPMPQVEWRRLTPVQQQAAQANQDTYRFIQDMSEVLDPDNSLVFISGDTKSRLLNVFWERIGRPHGALLLSDREEDRQTLLAILSDQEQLQSVVASAGGGPDLLGLIGRLRGCYDQLNGPNQQVFWMYLRHLCVLAQKAQE